MSSHAVKDTCVVRWNVGTLHRLVRKARGAASRAAYYALRSSGRGRVTVEPTARLLCASNTSLGTNARISVGARSVVDRASVLSVEGELVIGADCYFSIGTIIGANVRVHIGDHVAIGPYCVV